MRHARIKPKGKAFFHTYNQISGFPGDLPFGPIEKEYFVRLLKKLDKFYTVNVLSYQVMSNHFHLVLSSPDAPPSDEETCSRYEDHYDGKKSLSPGTPRCREIALRLCDISWFMWDLQNRFSRWFNRVHGRHGTLWAGRFKSTLLEYGLAVWDCTKYVEMNPVRAKMVEDPAHYRFSSWGAWSGTGRHPFKDNVDKDIMPVYKGILRVKTFKQLQKAFRKEYARMKAVDDRKLPHQIGEAMERAGKKIPFTRQLDQRVRYWVDGLVIGSELFVTQTMVAAREPAHMDKRRLTRAVDQPEGKDQLCCYRQLRVLAR